MFCANLGAVVSSAAAASYWINTASVILYDTCIDSTGAVYALSSTKLAKFTSSGTLIYKIAYCGGTGSTGVLEADNIIADSAGNCYIADFGSVNPGIAKINSSGAVVWGYVYNFGGAGAYPTSYKGLFFDAAGAVIKLWGPYSGAVYLTKLTTAGAISWQKNMAIPTSSAAPAPVGGGADSSNNVYFATYGTDYTSSITTVAKFNSAGTLQWQKDVQEAASGFNTVCCWADSAGNTYVTSDAKFCKINTSGVLQWQRQISPSGVVALIYCGVGDGTTGDVYVAGYMNISTVGWGIVMKINSTGTLQWVRKINKNVAAYNDYYIRGISLLGSSTLVLQMVGSAISTGVTIKIPTDGSKTGTYGNYQITADTSTLTTPTAYTVVAGTATISTPTGAMNAVTYVPATETFTNTLTTIP